MAKWVKGESGNPGGRPKGEGDIRELARAHTPKAIGTLVKILNDEDANPSARVAASIALLDRGWGRPTQTLHATLDTGQYREQVRDGLAESALELFKHMRGVPENTREAEQLPEKLPEPSPDAALNS